MGGISPVHAQAMYGNPYAVMPRGPFLERPSRVFSDGAFAPAPPIQPVPVDQPPPGGAFPGPRWWQYKPSINLPAPPGTEGLKLASFDQLRTLSQRYSVARSAIELRIEEIRALEWDITLTTDAAKAYQGDRKALRDFGERKALAKRFFRRPDPDFWNFDTFLNAFLEEIFVYDALTVIFRPKFGASFGMGGRGLLGSNLDSLNLVSGPTIRPLVDLHGGIPRPPYPAYQQYLFGVPRSDYMSMATGSDIEDAGLAGAEVNTFNTDVMLYAPYWRVRESYYGFPPVERALLPIISGLQKQEFQLDYYTEGTVPAVYISPGDTNITPTQIGELQNALNALAGDPAYHLKVVVLPPGSKVEPQRPVDLSDSFDFLVMNQVCMAFDVQPQELGIIPNVGATPTGPSAAGMRFAGQEKRDIKSRTSAKPLLKWICDIFNYVLHDICQQHDMQFQFEGLVDDEDKQAITTLGVEQVQNGIASVDEIRERLDLPPWGLDTTSGPVVFTPQGPVPFEMAPELIRAALTQSPSGSSSSGKKKTSTKQPSVKRGTSATLPNGSHPAPLAPSRATPAHAAAVGTLAPLRPQRGATGGTPSRSPVAGSRKRGEGMSPTRGRMTNAKAVVSELDALQRHIRKGRLISSWQPAHIDDYVLAMIAEDIAKGVLLDVAIKRAQLTALLKSHDDLREMMTEDEPRVDYLSGDDADDGFFDDHDDDDDGDDDEPVRKVRQFPGWEHDLGLVGGYKEAISQAFQDAEIRGAQLRKDAASGDIYVSANTLLGLISDQVRDIFTGVMTGLWSKAWDLGYDGACTLLGVSGSNLQARQGFLDTEGAHWADQVSRTGLGNSNARSEMIARTEVARAMNAAVIQCYRDNGVQYKHLMLAPDERACDICIAAKNEGIIPLDSVFPSGGLGGPFHPQCLPGSARVASLSPVRGASVRDYVGEFVVIKTASGNELTATPNHPVATRRGWVPISELQVGDHVLRSEHAQREVNAVYPDVNDVPPRIQDVAHALPMTLAAMPVSPEDFHGDGSGSEICIVRTDRLLVDDRIASPVLEESPEDEFRAGNIPVGTSALLDTAGYSFTMGKGLGTAPNGIMGGGSQAMTFVRTRPRHPGVHALAAIPGLYAGFDEESADWGAADSEGFCERLLALSGEVTLDEVVSVRRIPFRGQVFNLETSDGWYIANGIVTHNCRCVPAPAGITIEPPQAHIRKNSDLIRGKVPDGMAWRKGADRDGLPGGAAQARDEPSQDESRLCWLLLRAKDEDGKYRFLLQQRPDGTWGMPGGTPHVGEDPWAAAYRETSEEIGDLPGLKVAGTFHHVEDGKQVYLYLCDSPYFHPELNGSTPGETRGAAWFRRREIGNLNLTPKFKDDWENGITLKDNVTKEVQNLRNETGEWLELDDPDRWGATLGSRWPYPHRGSIPEEVPQNNRPGGGYNSGEMGATEPPRQGPQEMSSAPQARIFPRGAQDERFPRRRGTGTPARDFPSGPDGMHPSGGVAGSPGTEAQQVPGPVRMAESTGASRPKAPSARKSPRKA